MRINAPPNLPVTHPRSGAVNGPPPGHVMRKRKPESGSNPTAGPPHTFEPEFTVAESEELTRQLQEQEFAREISQEAEEDVENTVGDYDDEDPYIDPDLKNIPALEDDEGQPPLTQPLAHPRVQPFIPSGWTSSASHASTMTPSQPASATPLMQESTSISNVFTSCASSVTPTSSLFNLDKLANLDTVITNLATKVERLTIRCKTAAELEPQVQFLIEQNEILREIVDKHHSEIDLLNKTVAIQSGSLEELLTLIHDRCGSDAGVPSVRSVDKATKAVRDNIFNAAVRHTLLHVMGISDSRQAASLDPIPDGMFWVKYNGEWRDDMIKYVWQKACEVYAQLREEHLKKKTDADIMKQLKEVFENTRDAIKKGGKAPDKNHERGAEEVQQETGTNRPMWDWFYQVCYQSIDESDTGGGGPGVNNNTVDLASDTERAPQHSKKSAKSKSADTTWTSQPPAYRG
ncbi:hypothetical protein EDD22DRAFT_851089 [Suillus occidentalis]|nr:hypothetical protein EDD22DRAFT_851089 [Suillus occidentalis]